MRDARRRIEIERKGDFILEVVDADGRSVAASVALELQSHDFDFGANLFGFDKMPDSNPAKQVSLKAIEETFNTVIVCDYWRVNQWKRDVSLNWQSPDYGYKVAEQLGKRSRHHALLFGVPKWLHHYETEEELWEVIEQRIRNVANRYGDLITEVDVINEFINYQYWDQNPHAKYLKTTQYPDFAKPENGARVVKVARELMPHAKLVVLEAGIWNVPNPVFQEIYRYHKRLIEMGADYDYIGYQGHYYAKGRPFQEGSAEFGPRTFMMDEISRGIELIGSLGKPIVITEFNPPSRSNKSKWPDQPRLSDEEIAAWEANFYTLMFSKPYVKGISRWFTIDNLGGRGMDAGMVSEAGELKPNYFALKKLIKDDWHTELSVAPSRGAASFRGFYGKYRVKVSGFEDAVVSFTQGHERQSVTLVRE